MIIYPRPKFRKICHKKILSSEIYSKELLTINSCFINLTHLISTNNCLPDGFHQHFFRNKNLIFLIPLI